MEDLVGGVKKPLRLIDKTDCVFFLSKSGE